jgi:PadR family transcriptional regulator PadR
MAQQTQLMKGILEGCILSVVSARQSYGYKVVEAMRAFGFSDIAEATVYPILNRLEKKGDLKYEKRPSQIGPPRKYYGLTQQGKQALADFKQSWHNTSNIVQKVLEEESK